MYVNPNQLTIKYINLLLSSIKKLQLLHIAYNLSITIVYKNYKLRHYSKIYAINTRYKDVQKKNMISNKKILLQS